MVEDDLEFKETLRSTLSDAGYDVLCLGRGEDAVTIAEDVRPALITLDVMLPGIDGWEVLKRIKGSDTLADTPVVMVTASESHEIGLALGADDVLVKPLDLDRLVARIMTLAPPAAVASEVLVIDDDPNVVSIARAALEGHGYVVTSAASGPEGIEAARSRHPAAVILDLMMPGMNGFEVAAILQSGEETSAIPLIVLTARDLTGEDRAALNGKVKALLSKGNTNAAVLLETVKRLDSRRG